MSEYGAALAQILGSRVWLGPFIFWPLLGACLGAFETCVCCWSRSRMDPGPEVHWSLRASWAHGCRTAGWLSWLTTVAIVGFLSFHATEPLGLLGALITWSSMLGAAIGARLAFNALHPALKAQRTARQRFADLAFGPGTLYYWALAPLVWAPLVTSDFDHQTGMVLTLAVTLHFAWGGSTLTLWRSLGLVTAPTPELAALVRETAEHARVPLHRVSVWRWRTANAITFPHKREIALTVRLVEVLDDEELRGLVVHQLARLTEPRRMFLVRVCMTIAPLGLLLVRPMAATHGALAVVAVVASVVAVFVVGARASHRAERVADAATHREDASLAYARALSKIHEDRLLPAVTSRGTKSHHDLYERMLAAGVTPDFPRPPAPDTKTRPGVFVVLVLTLAFIGAATFIVRSLAFTADEMAGTAWFVTPAADDLIRLELNSEDEQTRALVSLGLATSGDPKVWIKRARCLAESGNCRGVSTLVEAAALRAENEDEGFMGLYVVLSVFLENCSE